MSSSSSFNLFLIFLFCLLLFILNLHLSQWFYEAPSLPIIPDIRGTPVWNTLNVCVSQRPHRAKSQNTAQCTVYITQGISTLSRLGKNELHELRRVKFLKIFSAKFVIFSAKFWCLNMQIRNKFKNTIFIACKWSKMCKYYVIRIVI